MATTIKATEVRSYPSQVQVHTEEGYYNIPCDGDAYVEVANKVYRSSDELARKFRNMNNQSISRVINRLLSLGYADYCGA